MNGYLHDPADAFSVAAQTAKKTLLTFEGLPSNATGTIAVPDDYGRLQWDAIRTIKPSEIDPMYGVTGYSTGLVSGEEVAYVSSFSGGYAQGEITSGSAANFSLVSAYLTAAWRDGETVTITGYDDGVERYVRTITINDDGPLFVRLDMLGVDRVVFYGTGGTATHATDYGANIVIDDLKVITGSGSISGVVFNDRNGNGIRNVHDEALANRLVYVDENHNGALDTGERRTRSAADGSYSFANLSFGEYDVGFVPGHGRTATTQPLDHYLFSYDSVAPGWYEGAMTVVTPVNSHGIADLDDGVYTLHLTTPLELWGRTYSTLYISVNGLIEFDGISEKNFENTQFPDTSRGPLIAPFWTDLAFTNGGQLRVAQDSVTHQVAVTWSDVKFYNSATANTFQVLISENGEIKFNYADISAPPSSDTNGVTIGLQGGIEDGISQPYFFPSDNTAFVFQSSLSYTYGAAHVVVDAGENVGVDFGQTKVPPSAFAMDSGVALNDQAPHMIGFVAHIAVEHVMLV